MKKIDLTKYGITGTTEVVYNPSYEMLFEEETKPSLEGYEKGQVSELGAVNVMTGIYTGRSPKDSSSLSMRIQRIPFGGHRTSIKTTTIPPQRKLGMQLRLLQSKSFQTRDFLL